MLGEHRPEHRFVDVQFQLVAVGIDERVGAARGELRVLGLHVVHARMRPERHIAGQRPRRFERPSELLRDAGRLRVVHQLEAGICAQAADNHHVVALAAFLSLQRPRGAAARMTRRQVRDERGSAKRYRFAIVQHFVDRMFLAARLHGAQRRHVFGERHHLRAGLCLHRRVALLVVAVRVAAEQDFDLRELETQLLDRLLNQRDVPLECAVDQDVALRGDDEINGEAPGADVVDVADHFVRRKRRRHVIGPTDVALEQRQLRESVSADGDGWPRLLRTAASPRGGLNGVPRVERDRAGSQKEQRHDEADGLIRACHVMPLLGRVEP
jgi:hypothetical protein